MRSASAAVRQLRRDSLRLSSQPLVRGQACRAEARLRGSPGGRRLVGLSRFELLTPRLSSVCSNQLSYRPQVDLLEPLFKEPDFAFGYVGQARGTSGVSRKPFSRLVHRGPKGDGGNSFKTR